MPKLSKTKRQTIEKLLRATGGSKKMTAAIMGAIQSETGQEAESATKEIHRQLLKELKRVHKQGVIFGEADLQEALGQDEIPPEFLELLEGEEPPPEPGEPVLVLEAPTGWSVKRVSSSLHIRMGKKTIGEARIIEDRSYNKRLRSIEIRDSRQNPALPNYDGYWTKLPVQFGDSHGFKFTYHSKSPPWKRVEYLLQIPGGRAGIMLDAHGKDFDETPFETKLKTLRISQTP
jgi:hypothetical protein